MMEQQKNMSKISQILIINLRNWPIKSQKISQFKNKMGKNKSENKNKIMKILEKDYLVSELIHKPQ